MTLEQAISMMNTQLMAIRAQQEALTTVITTVLSDHDEPKTIKMQQSINELIGKNMERMKKEHGL